MSMHNIEMLWPLKIISRVYGRFISTRIILLILNVPFSVRVLLFSNLPPTQGLSLLLPMVGVGLSTCLQ